MTSQLNGRAEPATARQVSRCRPPLNASHDYCQRLKSGLERLEAMLLQQYEETFPSEKESIGRALRAAKEAAWLTTFPSLFFPVLAHLRMHGMRPLT